jgi:hypothetical protein
MPHLPENNPLEQIRREVNNIRFMLRRGETEYIPARLDFLVQGFARLAIEQETLKSAFKQKAREANLFKLKCIHWREQYERSEQERHRLQRALYAEGADHSATRAALAQAELTIARLKGGSHA